MRDLAELRAVDEADVYKGDRRAGTLARDGDDVIFAYRDGYLASDRPVDIARTLPCSAEPVVTPAGAVPPFFAGLLPEGVRLRAVALGSRSSEDDHLTLLMAVGQDAVGDVRVLPTGQEPTRLAPVFDEERADRTDLTETFANATSNDVDTLHRVALPGVQVKVSAQMASTPVSTSAGPAILKLNPPEGHPRLVQNERFFLTMADACGLPVPAHRLVYEHGDGSRPLALTRVVELIAFSYLIGNGDLHGKNISVRATPAGFWEVTPFYDLISTQPYLNWKDPMTLDLYGRSNRLTRTHLLESAHRLAAPSRAVASSLDRICDTAPAWIDRLDEIGFDTPTTERLAAMMRERLHELRS